MNPFWSLGQSRRWKLNFWSWFFDRSLHFLWPRFLYWSWSLGLWFHFCEWLYSNWISRISILLNIISRANLINMPSPWISLHQWFHHKRSWAQNLIDYCGNPSWLSISMRPKVFYVPRWSYSKSIVVSPWCVSYLVCQVRRRWTKDVDSRLPFSSLHGDKPVSKGVHWYCIL